MTPGEAEREVEAWAQKLALESPALQQRVEKDREALKATERLAAEHAPGGAPSQPTDAQVGGLVSDEDLGYIEEETKRRAAAEVETDA